MGGCIAGWMRGFILFGRGDRRVPWQVQCWVGWRPFIASEYILVGGFVVCGFVVCRVDTRSLEYGRVRGLLGLLLGTWVGGWVDGRNSNICDFRLY